MENNELFTIIGKLYVDVYNSQRFIDILQQQLRAKEQEILELNKPKDIDE